MIYGVMFSDLPESERRSRLNTRRAPQAGSNAKTWTRHSIKASWSITDVHKKRRKASLSMPEDNASKQMQNACVSQAVNRLLLLQNRPFERSQTRANSPPIRRSWQSLIKLCKRSEKTAKRRLFWPRERSFLWTSGSAWPSIYLKFLALLYATTITTTITTATTKLAKQTKM